MTVGPSCTARPLLGRVFKSSHDMVDPMAVERTRARLGIASLWSALSRRRSHQLLDLLLGLAFLAGIANLIGSWSPILALALVAVVAGFYPASLHRQEQDRKEPTTPPDPLPVEECDAIDALEELLATAPVIPLAREVRMDPAAVTPLVNAIQTAVAPASSEQVDELARVFLSGRPVPLTGELRVDRKKAQELLADLRSASANTQA